MKKFILFLLMLVSLLVLYALFLSPNILIVNEYFIKSESLPEGFDNAKITHFSDLHYTPSNEKQLKKLANTINEQNPDIVVFTGDLTKEKLSKKYQQTLLDNLSNITAKIGKYAILGDEDSNDSKDILSQSGFVLLNDSMELIFNNDIEPITIYSGNVEDKLLDNYSIYLSHKPDDVDKLTSKKPNLILAGHSLGGQIRIPYWGALIKTNGSKKYTNNHYELGESQMYISFGIGCGDLGIRVFNEPSINVYRLKKA